MSAAVLALVLQAGVAPVPGDLLVTNFGDDTVTWFHHTTGEYGGVFVAEGSGGLERPVGPVFAPEGDLLVASAGTHQILRYDGATGAYEGVFAEHERLRIPSLMAHGPDGALYVGTFQGGQVLRLDAVTGELLGVAGHGLAAPIGIAFDAEGRLLVASAGQNRIARFDPRTGEALADFARGDGLEFPAGLAVADDVEPAALAVDGRGRVLVGDLENSRLHSIPATGASAVLLSTRGLAGPEGIAFVPPPGATPTRRIP